MQFKKLILVLIFTISIIFVTAICGTYAYYNISGGSISGTTGTISTGISVVFSGSNTFDFNVGVPIQSSEVLAKAARVNYDIYANDVNFLDEVASDKFDIYVNVDFIDADIDDELKISDFKYRTICSPTYDGALTVSNSDEVNSGTGTDFNNQTFNSSKRLNILSMDNDIFDAIATLHSNEIQGNPTSTVRGYRVSCSTYIWLEESGVNQNTLMGKHFGANIEVNTYVKKR